MVVNTGTLSDLVNKQRLRACRVLSTLWKDLSESRGREIREELGEGRRDQNITYGRKSIFNKEAHEPERGERCKMRRKGKGGFVEVEYIYVVVCPGVVILSSSRVHIFECPREVPLDFKLGYNRL